MRVLLVEPYYGGSHRAWADGYAANSGHHVTIVSHEARFWKWRMKGAHLTLAADVASWVDRQGIPPDIVLVSGMMDVAGFLGASRRVLTTAPVAVFFHENQFTYPLSPLDHPDLSYAMVNWSSAASADLAIFNSEFHRTEFFSEAEFLLKRFPDRRHGGLVDAVAQRSTVLPVGVDLRRIDLRRPGTRGHVPLLLWNQRWEHDKGPGRFVSAVEALVEAGTAFRLAVTGERFVSAPDSFVRLPGLLGDRLVQYGFASDDRYVDLLLEANVVVSTAEQEFFGVAVVEAMYAGAFPVLPDRVVYPERIPLELHDRCLYADADDLVAKLRSALLRPGEGRPEDNSEVVAVLQRSVADCDWAEVAPRYDAALERLVQRPA